MNKKAVLSLSGGLDSSTLLLHLLANGFDVQCLSFDYGQKHRVELERATELVKHINKQLPSANINHQIIKLDGLSQLLHSSLVEGGSDVPEGHYEQTNMSETVVPNRNKIFSSIIQATALSLAEKNNTECVIAMGIHAGDHAIYKDCTQQFRDSDYQAFVDGNENAHLVTYYTPYINISKADVLKDGIANCLSLGLDYKEIYKRTNTSYKPIYVPRPESTSRVEEAHRTVFGDWYSDYKSGSSVERILSFVELNIEDPVQYAEENGTLVTWEHVKEHALKIEKEFNSRK